MNFGTLTLQRGKGMAIMTLFLLLLMSTLGLAATVTSNQSGNWNTGSTWVGGAVPLAGDDVVIANGHTVTMDISPTALSLNINSGGTLDANGNTLTVTGNTTIDGNLDDLTGGSTIQVAGNFTINSSGSWDQSGSLISLVFNGSAGTQTISGSYSTVLEFDNFTVNASGAVVDNNLTADFIVSTQFNLSAGTFQAGSSTFSLDNGVNNFYVFNKTGGTFTAESSTFKVTSNRNVRFTTDDAITFNNVTHTPTGSRTLTLDESNAGSVNYTITNTLAIEPFSNGIRFLNGAGIAYSGTTTLNYTTGNNITMTNEWPGTNGPTNVSVNSSGTYTLGATRSVAGNFTKTGSGNFQLSGGVTLTIDAAGVFALNGGTFTVDGTNIFTVNGRFDKGAGTFTLGTGTIAYGGSSLLRYTSGQTTGSEWTNGLSVQNVTVGSGTVTIAGSSGRAVTDVLTVSSTLNAGPNALTVGNGAGTDLSVSGTLNGSANVTVSGNTNIAASATVALTSADFSTVDLTMGSSASLSSSGGAISASGDATIGGSASVNSAAGTILLSGDVSLDHASELNTTNTATVNGNLSISGSATVGQAAAGTLIMNGNANTNVNINGTIEIFNFTVNKTFGSAVTVSTTSGSQMRFNSNGTLRVQQGTLQLSSTSQILDTSGGSINDNNLTLTVDATGVFRTGGTDIAGFASFNLADNSLIDFSGTSAEDIPAATYGDITITNSHSSGATAVGTLTLQVNSDINVSGTSRLNLNNQTITNAGGSDALNVAAGASLYTGGTSLAGFSTTSFGGTVHFTGSSQETVPASTTFNNVTVNNSGGIALGGAATINGTLTFTNGKVVTTSGNLLTLGASATATPTSSNFVQGPVARATDGTATSFAFPTGNATNLRNVTINFVSAPTTANTITVEANGAITSPTSTDPDIKSIEADGDWAVSTTLGTIPNYTITVVTTNFSPAISAASNVTLARGTNPAYNTQGTSESSGSSQVTASFTTSFGDFAVANLTSSFTWDGGGVDNNWSTAANWTSDIVPSNGDVIVIPGSFTVVYDAGVSATNFSSITLSGTGNTFTLTGGILDLNATPLTVGNGDQVTFNGTTISAYNSGQTTYSTGSTVQFNSGTVQGDAYHHLNVNNSGTVTSSAAITVAGNFTKSAAGEFQANGTFTVTGTTTLSAGTVSPGTTFTLNGNVVGNGGQFNSGSGTVTLSGGAAQTISGSTAISFNNVTLNNSNGLTLSQAATVEGTLTLTSGVISTGSNNLTLGQSSSVSGASSARYISGRLAKEYGGGAQSFTYPTGKGGVYLPVTLDFASLTAGYTRVVEQINSPADGLDPDIVGADLSAVSSVRYWEISRVGATGDIGGAVQVTLTWTSTDGISNNTALDVAQLATDGANSGSWQTLGGDGAGTSASGTIQSVAFISAGDYYTFGDDAAGGQDNSLPVELASFKAQPEFSKVMFEWTTASESNNLGFDIYRKDIGSDAWERLTDDLIAGQGNSSSEADYSFVDYDVTSGKQYTYKLESVSFSGKVEVEKVIDITVPIPDQFVLHGNYPNPFNPVTNIKFQLPEASKVTLTVYDLAGRKVKTLINGQSFTAGEHVQTWNATNKFGQKVSSGMYIYKFDAGKFSKIGRMLLLK